MQFKKIFSISHFRKPKTTKKKIIYTSIVIIFLVTSIYFYFLLKPFSPFIAKIPAMAGFTGKKNYLVLLQNNSERRPSGGFITAYAEVSFFFGFPSLKINNSYDLPAPIKKITPPYPLNKLLADDIFYEGFVFRDANWSPDFQISAKEVLKFYHEGKKIQDPNNKDLLFINGVIAIDVTAIEKLFAFAGDIIINNDLINQKNLFHKMQFYSKNVDLHSVNELQNRKNIMKDILPILIKKIILSPTNYFKVRNEIEKLLQQKHIQLYFNNDQWQSIASQKHWSGEFQPQTNNFVHINIANIGGRKADRYIIPQYNYYITFDYSGKATANLDLSFYHSGTQGLYSDFYQAYIRAYLPTQITDLKHSGDNKLDFVIESDLNATSVGTLVHIWPGETQNLHFSYTLPISITPNNYNLQIIPMAGNIGENWHVNLRYINNDNFWQSTSFSNNENIANYQNTIYQDTLLTATLLEDKTPPVIIWQKFLDKNTIDLLFSEKLNDKSLQKMNFSLVDKNIMNSEIIDYPIVSEVIQDENYHLIIKVLNSSWQYEEHFTLNMENIADLNNNFIVPNPKEITLIQR